MRKRVDTSCRQVKAGRAREDLAANRILHELSTSKKPAVGLISTLPMGTGFDAQTRSMRDPWAVQQQLDQSFDVRQLTAASVKSIDKDSGIGANLTQLRKTVEDLDPGRGGALTKPRKLFGLIPLGNRMRGSRRRLLGRSASALEARPCWKARLRP